MSRPSFPFFVPLALLGVVAFAGCASSGGEGADLGRLVRNPIRDLAVARTYDDAQVALARNNPDAIQDAGQRLKRLAEGSDKSENMTGLMRAWVVSLAQDAGTVDAQGRNSQGFDRTELEREAETKYRAALSFLPSDKSELRQFDSQTLNTLGYHLADDGKTREDFQQAETLTRISYLQAPQSTDADKFLRATGPGDSLAWALFKLGKAEEARKQAETVADVIAQSKGLFRTSAEFQASVDPEILYHMGAIYRVLGDEKKAQAAFRAALTLNPKPDMEKQLNLLLDGSLV